MFLVKATALSTIRNLGGLKVHIIVCVVMHLANSFNKLPTILKYPHRRTSHLMHNNILYIYLTVPRVECKIEGPTF